MINRDITFVHDDISYEWHDVPEEKYRNWEKMLTQKPDTDHFSAAGFPFVLQIEPTSFCNLACPLCPAGRNELERDRRHLTFDEFRSVVDDMENYLLLLILWNWGEPLMNPELPAMIQYASARGIKTVTSTNGHWFGNDRYIEALLKSGLSTLIVAIDSVSDENYEVYRRKGNLGKAVEGLKNVIDIKRRTGAGTVINMRMVIMRHNENELPATRRMAKELGVDIFTVKTVNPSCGGKSMDDSIIPENPGYRRYKYKQDTYERVRTDAICQRVWFMSNIFSNGDVVTCCYDYNSEMKVGNIRERKFSEIWNSSEYCSLREKIYRNKDVFEKCRICGCNFELAHTGWFVEAIDFRKPIEARKNLRDYFGMYLKRARLFGKKLVEYSQGRILAR